MYPIVVQVFIRELKSDLRGIETYIYNFYWAGEYVLKSDLRGIETLNLERGQTLVKSLKSDLRGIETNLSCIKC